MLKLLVFLRYTIVFCAVFLGFFFASQPDLALKIVSLGMVGAVGILSFITHVPLHKADAARLGWKTERPDWQFEVGFANLSFGLASILAAFWCGGMRVVLICYAIYLLQAAILHGYRALSVKPVELARLFRSSFLTLIYSVFMIYFAVYLK